MSDAPNALDSMYLDLEHFDLIARSQPPLQPRSRVEAVGPQRMSLPGLLAGGQRDAPCTCCSRIRVDGAPRNLGPAVARWTCRNGGEELLCLHCLNCWFDNADDDPDLEPAAWSWLDTQGAATR